MMGHVVMAIWLNFYEGQCILREWVVGRGRLYGHFGEQGMPVGFKECLDGFHQGCVDYLIRQFIPNWNSSNCECWVGYGAGKCK